MDSEPEDGRNSNNSTSDLKVGVEVNGEHTPHKNGNHQVTEDALVLPGGQAADSTEKSESSCEKAVPVADSSENSTDERNNSFKDAETISRELLSEALELKPVNPSRVKPDASKEQQSKNETNGDANGKESVLKDGKPLVQRRMSLRTRAAPKKYSDDQEGVSSDEEMDKDPLAAKDPLEIPLGKHSSTVLIRKSPNAAVTMLRSPPKSPVKLTKVTRPPPELIKAPLSNKLSISPATSVTVVPRSKENSVASNKPGFVVVDTQSILKGKSSVPAHSVQASVTVSAVAPSTKAPVSKSVTAPASSTASRKSAPSNVHASLSAPSDPFESLGQFSLFRHIY